MPFTWKQLTKTKLDRTRKNVPIFQVPIAVAEVDYPCPKTMPGYVTFRVEVQNPHSEQDNGALWIILPADDRVITEEGGLVFSDLQDDLISTSGGPCRQEQLPDVLHRLSLVSDFCLVCMEGEKRTCAADKRNQAK